MTTGIVGSDCFKCKKANAILKCGGCLKDFCYNDFGHHRQDLNKELDQIETTRDILRQDLLEQSKDPTKHALIQQIDQWEIDSIQKIERTAEETRRILLVHTKKSIDEIEIRLESLTDRLKQNREDNNFLETHLSQWNEQLKELQKELIQPSKISVGYRRTSFINQIYPDVSSKIFTPKIPVHSKWAQNGITVAGGNGRGNGLNQLSAPQQIYIDDDQTIYVADYANHRIMEWKNGAASGRVVAGGNGQGNRDDQLNGPVNVIVDKESDSLIISDWTNRRVVQWPRRNGSSGKTIISNIACWSLSMDDDGYLYVSDIHKDEVRQWKIGDKNGTLVAGGNGQGKRLDQLSSPYYIFVDKDHSVYASDAGNHRVIKWLKGAREGIIVAGDQGAGNALTQLSNPYGLVVDQLGTVYVANSDNQRVMRWLKDARESTVMVGGNDQGGQANQFNGPRGLSFDRENNLYVVDNGNHRIQKFLIQST